jgi:hypothetical protein
MSTRRNRRHESKDHTRRVCGSGLCSSGKVCYPTRADARAAMKKLRTMGEEHMPGTALLNVYKCAESGLYHVGHATQYTKLRARGGEVA